MNVNRDVLLKHISGYCPKVFGGAPTQHVTLSVRVFVLPFVPRFENVFPICITVRDCPPKTKGVTQT